MHYNGETKQNKILIKTLGGNLGIKFEYDSNKSSYHRIFLEGDINLVYEGDIELL
jgi:diaminopimelate epimerase